jgi:hypothetical protein
MGYEKYADAGKKRHHNDPMLGAIVRGIRMGFETCLCSSLKLVVFAG